MKFKVFNPRVSFDLSGKMSLTVDVDHDHKPIVKAGIGELQDKPLAVEIKPFRNRRSLDANAFAWVLIGKIAAKLNASPTEIYREAIREIGGNYEVVPVKKERAEAWKRIWESRGLGWISETIGDSKHEGYENIVSYCGSSEYDKAQMARLIDRIIEDCKELAIDTATPAEIALLKEGWGK